MSHVADLPYDYEDFGLSIDELKSKYAFTGEHPEYTIELWRSVPEDVHNPIAYWNWVLINISKDDDDY